MSLRCPGLEAHLYSTTGILQPTPVLGAASRHGHWGHGDEMYIALSVKHDAL